VLPGLTLKRRVGNEVREHAGTHVRFPSRAAGGVVVRMPGSIFRRVRIEVRETLGSDATEVIRAPD
jgi:hypothetical protein